MATMPTVVPSASSSSGWTYDVFLSFRGEDTRKNFTSHLYAALVRKGIKTFKDDKEIKIGEVISEALQKAIKESRSFIIIFSRNYADSHWCLDELALIMEESHGPKVFPVFLEGVDPLEVQDQTGSFGDAFGELAKDCDGETVKRWRSALRACCSTLRIRMVLKRFLVITFLSLWKSRDEAKLIAQIVEDVSGGLSEILSPNPVIEIPSEPIKIENQPSTKSALLQMLDCIGDPRFSIIGVYVSATPNLRSIQDSISKCLGLPDNSGADALFKALMKKKFLLIFDDVWCKLKLMDVGIPHPVLNNKGSKILIISRIQDICTDMDARKTIKVEPLSDAESWELFVDIAGEHVAANDIKRFAEKIVGRCKGLPLAIVIVAHAMANRHGVGLWENALWEMELSATEIRGMKEEVFVPLKFSFDRLENDMLRSLFLYCACFCEDYNFEIGGYELLDYCIGKGLVDKLGSLKAARNKVEDLIESLKIACMLEDGDHKSSTVKMHDMMRELALWITSSEYTDNSSLNKFLIRTGESVTDLFKVKRIACTGNAQTATSLVLFYCEMLDQQILGSECVEGLSNLRYLNPEGTNVSIPMGIISCLHKLEELKLSRAKKINWRVSTDRKGQRDEQERSGGCSSSIDDYSISMIDIVGLELRRCRVVRQDALQALINESQNLQFLTIEDCQGVTCGRICDTGTKLINCEDLEEVMDGLVVDHQCPNGLLILIELPKLKKICVGLAPINCFNQLMLIDIERCHSLKMVFTKEMRRHSFKYLYSILVSDCERMDVIIEADDDDAKEEEVGELLEENNNNINGEVISLFPKLRFFILVNLPTLAEVCTNHILHCPLINEMKVRNCPRINKDPLPIQNTDGLLVIIEGEEMWKEGSNNKVVKKRKFKEIQPGP
ncbi:probable disease resistance protein At1g61300 [Telopea speciosissima]|uniref:probable disease resistance protein At1g61300 n=1 Tax=Telopea speciosissima TaxID=54955 RepID=UPI001CC5FF7B|nr:probable disease resistance protein At1g61300 [Telopea speciosissima]